MLCVVGVVAGLPDEELDEPESTQPQHTSAYVSIREKEHDEPESTQPQHTSAYVSIRQHTSERARRA